MQANTRKNIRRIVWLMVVTVICAAVFTFLPAFGMGHDGPPQKDMKIDQATRVEVIEAVIANLNQYYVFPEKAAAMEKRLRQELQNGDYDKISSANELAEKIGESLQAQTQDKHLELRYFEESIPVQKPGEDVQMEMLRRQSENVRLNYGFHNVDRLSFNIGYIDIHSFADSPHAFERMAAAMNLLSDTKAMIIDLRKNGGGSPETVALYASYFHDKRTHLNDIYMRPENKTDEMWTTENVPGKKYGETRKLYLLTSADTFSAAEDFAYAMKNNKRATIIGEVTGGGAHPGDVHRLRAHFMMNVPAGRTISPITHTDWEVVGVQPDIKVSADDALDQAQLIILKDFLKTEKDPEWRAHLEESIAELD
ncbi:MAG: S41 family peptidase [Arenimonas sp.]